MWDDSQVSTTTGLPGSRPVNAPLPLLVLGRGRDLASERGVECPGDLPGALRPRPRRAGPRRQGGARRPGVRARPPLPARRGHRVRRRHRRLLQAGPGGRGPAGRASTSSSAACTSWPSRPTSSPATQQTVVLPDLAAGCSMADMAAIAQVEDVLGRRWSRAGVADDVVPGHLHELLRGDQGVHRPARRHRLHVVATPSTALQLGVRPARRPTGGQGAVPARPAPRPQHRRRATSGSPSRTASSGTRTGRTAA